MTSIQDINPERTKVFFVTLRTKGEGSFCPPANSETKEARTMKLSTVIAYYKTSITKQLTFLNSHCSTVCGYCSVFCLMAKSKLKDKVFNFFFKLNEIHTIDSFFKEDSKICNFSREALLSGEEQPENLEKMSNNRDIYYYANRGVVNFERAYHPYPMVPKSLWCLNFPTRQTKF